MLDVILSHNNIHVYHLIVTQWLYTDHMTMENPKETLYYKRKQTCMVFTGEITEKHNHSSINNTGQTKENPRLKYVGSNEDTN